MNESMHTSMGAAAGVPGVCIPKGGDGALLVAPTSPLVSNTVLAEAVARLSHERAALREAVRELLGVARDLQLLAGGGARVAEVIERGEAALDLGGV